MREKKSPLPRWANFMPRTNDAEETSLKEEEFQLRQRAYAIASQRITNSHARAVEESTDVLIGPLSRFFVQFQPNSNCGIRESERKDEGKKRKRRSDFDFHLHLTTARYDPTLLPIAMLRLSPSERDVEPIAQLLKHRLSSSSHNRVEMNENSISEQRESNFCPAVCRMTKLGSAVEAGDIVRDILFQCVEQEPNPYEYKYLVKHRKSWMLRFIEWASLTTTFNAIVVIFEISEAIPQHLLDSLIGTMSGFRSDSGVPISLLFCSRCSDLVQKKLSTIHAHSLQGEAGAVVKDFEISSSSAILEKLFDNMHSKKIEGTFLPIIFNGHTLRNIKKDFVQYHRSVSTAVLQLRIAIAHHFARRGSFLALAKDETFLRMYRFHLAWFVVDVYGRERILNKGDEVAMSCGRDKLLKTIDSSYDDICHQIIMNQFATTNRRTMTLNDDIETSDIEYVYSKIRDAPLSQLIDLVLSWIANVNVHCKANSLTFVGNHLRNGDIILTKNSSNLSLVKFCNVLKQLLVVITAVQDGQVLTPEMHHDFREHIVATLHPFIWAINTKAKCPLSIADYFICKIERIQFSVEPRRMIASSILMPPEGKSKLDALSQDTGVLAICFETRFVSLDSLYQMFIDASNPDADADDGVMMKRFALAAYQMIYCGFITRSRRREDSFEKVAMAWTSID
mmetsp:Transcript_28304/g.43367  ORF Transcript_28304/g.43367 Transcript_28304/m.43367 type:complete len:679 (+) Transcript_28304:356-2392(+)